MSQIILHDNATQNGQQDVVQILMKYSYNTDVHKTLIHIAAQNGDHNVVQWLVTEGTDVNSKDLSLIHI